MFGVVTKFHQPNATLYPGLRPRIKIGKFCKMFSTCPFNFCRVLSLCFGSFEFLKKIPNYITSEEFIIFFRLYYFWRIHHIFFFFFCFFNGYKLLKILINWYVLFKECCFGGMKLNFSLLQIRAKKTELWGLLYLDSGEGGWTDICCYNQVCLLFFFVPLQYFSWMVCFSFHVVLRNVALLCLIFPFQDSW